MPVIYRTDISPVWEVRCSKCGRWRHISPYSMIDVFCKRDGWRISKEKNEHSIDLCPDCKVTLKLTKVQAGEYKVVAVDGHEYTFSHLYFEHSKEWVWIIGGENIGLGDTQYYFDPFYTLKEAKEALERTIETYHKPQEEDSC